MAGANLCYIFPHRLLSGALKSGLGLGHGSYKGDVEKRANPEELKSSIEEFRDSPNETNRKTVLLKQHLLH